MALCPLLSLINHGTFVTFPSAQEDINSAMNPDQTLGRFKFSRYALLRLPEIEAGSTLSANRMDFAKNFTGTLNTNSDPNAKNRYDLSESLQNYVMNFETLLTSDPRYNRSLPTTTSERIFWKWLKKTTAVSFGGASSNDTDQTDLLQESTDTDYRRVVQYLAEVEISGMNTKFNENQYNEVYVNIPTTSGGTPAVLFKSFQDDNYKPDYTVSGHKYQGYISGYDEALTTTAGLRNTAFFDDDPSFEYRTASSADYPTTDGIMLDWNLDHYNAVRNYNSTHQEQITTFNQLNSISVIDNFKFNAVLLYYDIYDDDGKSLATNLFGVLFLTDLKLQSGNVSRFDEYEKVRQNNLNALAPSGNGYGFKLNFKFDVSTSSVSKKVEVSVNDFNTFSMSLFADAVQNITQLSRNYERLLAYTQELIAQNQKYQDLLGHSQLLTLCRQIIENQNSLLVDNVDHKELLQLIKKNNDTLREILAGRVSSISVENSLSVFTEGNIKATLSGNRLSLYSDGLHYDSIVKCTFDFSQLSPCAENTIGLSRSSMLVYHDSPSGVIPQLKRDHHIYIDNGLNKFYTGQVISVVFSHGIKSNGSSIVFFTKDNNGSYTQIARSTAITSATWIDLICVSASPMRFVIKD